MLVLSRKTDESICIGDNIVVTVLSVQGTKVRIGIQAPREVPIVRSEIRDHGFTGNSGIHTECEHIALTHPK